MVMWVVLLPVAYFAAIIFNLNIGPTELLLALVLWLVGFLVLALVWFMTSPSESVVVYGPEGQQVTVSEKEAKRRVGKGWRYQPPDRT